MTILQATNARRPGNEAATKSRFLGLRHDYSLRFVALGNLYFPLRFDGETCLLGPGKIPDEK